MLAARAFRNCFFQSLLPRPRILDRVAHYVFIAWSSYYYSTCCIPLLFLAFSRVRNGCFILMSEESRGCCGLGNRAMRAGPRLASSLVSPPKKASASRPRKSARVWLFPRELLDFVATPTKYYSTVATSFGATRCDHKFLRICPLHKWIQRVPLSHAFLDRIGFSLMVKKNGVIKALN